MFTLYRHMRLIGLIAVVVNLFIQNIWLLVGGLLVFVWSYQLSVQKIERLLEKLEVKEEGKEQEKERE